jgi:hypothetical protein
MLTRVLAVVFVLGLAVTSLAAQSNGNPTPGYPHDTIIIHVKKNNGPMQCDGGHSLFVTQTNGVVDPALIYITMTDWVQVDNDGDGAFDEDPADGADNDLDGATDEDGDEPGKDTRALDCDGSDGVIRLQIRDADPRHKVVSTQEWFIRMIGKPEENFAFTSYANQTVECHIVDPTPDLPDSGDESVECTSGDVEDWIELASFNLAELGCAKQVKLGGKNGVSAGGKTPFCDITKGFLVDVDADLDGDGTLETPLEDQFIFSVSCPDNPDTDLFEPDFCPLSNIIWDVDEENTTSKAKAQIFVGHTGSANVISGKIKPGGGN